MAETSGTKSMRRSRSSSWSLSEMPRTGPRDALHEVRHEARDFVAHALRRDDGDLITNPLVRVEVDAEPRVVLLDDDARRLLDGLRADAHLGLDGSALHV